MSDGAREAATSFRFQEVGPDASTERGRKASAASERLWPIVRDIWLDPALGGAAAAEGLFLTTALLIDQAEAVSGDSTLRVRAAAALRDLAGVIEHGNAYVQEVEGGAEGRA